MLKRFLTVLVLAFAVLTFPKSLFAFGITPAELNVEKLKPGGRYEREVYVTRPPDEVNEALNVTLETDLGEMESWFTFIPGKVFPFPDGKNVTSFKVRVNVPENVEIKSYKGQITAKGVSDKRSSQGVTIVKGAVLQVNIETSITDTLDLRVLSITAPDVESGDPVRLFLKIQNLGNTAAAPERVDLEIMDLFEKPMESLSTSSLTEIDAYTTEEIEANFNSDLEKGQYRVDAIVYFNGEEIKKEKLVLTVNAKPAKLDEEKAISQTSVPDVNQQIYGFALTTLGMALLIILLVLLLKKKGENDPDFEKKLSKLAKENKVLSWILVVLSLILVFAGIYFALINTTVVSDKVIESREASDEDPGTVTPILTPTPENSVKGVSVETREEVEPFVISRPQTPGKYPVYQNSDFNSEIIYEADNGETFNVITESNGWFQVVLDDGTLGWLHETSIKEKN